MTGCDGSNCANPNPDYDPTDPTSEFCLVACEAGTYRCSQSNLERCKDDGSGYEFVTACPAGEACFQGTCIDESKVPEQTLIGEGGEATVEEGGEFAEEGGEFAEDGGEFDEEDGGEFDKEDGGEFDEEDDGEFDEEDSGETAEEEGGRPLKRKAVETG